MTQECNNTYILKTTNPIHIIKPKIDNSRILYENYGLWLDLEKGSDNLLHPLTNCIKFSTIEYKNGIRIEKDVFKITNVEGALFLHKILGYYIKEWYKKMTTDIKI